LKQQSVLIRTQVIKDVVGPDVDLMKEGHVHAMVVNGIVDVTLIPPVEEVGVEEIQVEVVAAEAVGQTQCPQLLPFPV
jgi:hypothetical protein